MRPRIEIRAICALCSLATAFVAAPRPAAGAPVAPESEVVNLPAFVVDGADGRGLAAPVHWLHAELPGIEFLSSSSQEVTEHWVAEISDQARLLGWNLPPGLARPIGKPLVAIHDNRPFASLRLALSTLRPQGSARNPRAVVVGTAITNWDFASLYQQRAQPSAAPASGIVAVAALALVVQQPGWSHVERLLGRAQLNVSAVGDGVDVFQPNDTLAENKLVLPGLAYLFTPFEEPPGKKRTYAAGDEVARWFGRWALYADDGEHQRGFWDFAQAIAPNPRIDDALAEEYFGMSLANLEIRVTRFRQRFAAQRVIHLRLRAASGTMPPTVRDATEEEIACAIIQWCLLTARQTPSLTAPLMESARRAIARARDEGIETPRLQAMCGLVELADGEIGNARALLESVAGDRNLNPGARVELAKLRLAEAIAQPRGTGGKISAAQASLALAPLAPFLENTPASPEPFTLMLQAWQLGGIDPSRAELIRFVACARQFPREHELLLDTAQLCARRSLNHEASDLAALGRDAAETEEIRAPFLELLRRLERGAE